MNILEVCIVSRWGKYCQKTLYNVTCHPAEVTFPLLPHAAEAGTLYADAVVSFTGRLLTARDCAAAEPLMPLCSVMRPPAAMRHISTVTVATCDSYRNHLSQFYWSIAMSVSVCVYTYGESTSQNLWSRYDRHFVGIAWHSVNELMTEDLPSYSNKT